MPKYEVDVRIEIDETYTVEADSEAEAERLAEGEALSGFTDGYVSSMGTRKIED